MGTQVKIMDNLTFLNIIKLRELICYLGEDKKAGLLPCTVGSLFPCTLKSSGAHVTGREVDMTERRAGFQGLGYGDNINYGPQGVTP